MYSTKNVVHLICQNKKTMKTQSVKSKEVSFTKTLAVIMPRQNGTPEQFAAFQETLNRVKERK